MARTKARPQFRGSGGRFARRPSRALFRPKTAKQIALQAILKANAAIASVELLTGRLTADIEDRVDMLAHIEDNRQEIVQLKQARQREFERRPILVVRPPSRWARLSAWWRREVATMAEALRAETRR